MVKIVSPLQHTFPVILVPYSGTFLFSIYSCPLFRHFQVKKYRLPPSIRGFKVDQILDNTLYLVCVVTRGSSWRGGLDVSDFGDSDFKIEPGFDDDDDAGEDEGDEEYDIEALEALGLIRTERYANDEVTENENENEISNMAGDVLTSITDWMMYGGQDLFKYNASIDLDMYPSSNDTHLMVTKPMLVNLGSKSSKCTEIKTPMDPHKMRFIDNKRMSIIIGCTAGILIFIFILISILMNREEKEEEDEEIPGQESIDEGSHKSPSSKTNRSDSLTFTPRPNHRVSRNNSQSSSLLNNRMSLIEAAGPDAPRSATMRNSTSGNPTTPSASNSLKRKGTLTRQRSQQDQVHMGSVTGNGPLVPNNQVTAPFFWSKEK